MIEPDFKTFCRLAKRGNLVPVYETFTADLLTPVGAYLRMAKQSRYACLLESHGRPGGDHESRPGLLGASEVVGIVVHAGQLPHVPFAVWALIAVLEIRSWSKVIGPTDLRRTSRISRRLRSKEKPCSGALSGEVSLVKILHKR